jgi:hypothetical protein
MIYADGTRTPDLRGIRFALEVEGPCVVLVVQLPEDAPRERGPISAFRVRQHEIRRHLHEVLLKSENPRLSVKLARGAAARLYPASAVFEGDAVILNVG